MQLLQLFHGLNEREPSFKSQIDEGRLELPDGPHACAPGRYWVPYRRAPMGIVDEKRISRVVVVEETRSTLYILTWRDRTFICP